MFHYPCLMIDNFLNHVIKTMMLHTSHCSLVSRSILSHLGNAQILCSGDFLPFLEQIGWIIFVNFLKCFALPWSRCLNQRKKEVCFTYTKLCCGKNFFISMMLMFLSLLLLFMRWVSNFHPSKMFQMRSHFGAISTIAWIVSQSMSVS